MNQTPVVIDDDDVVMVESDVIIDLDDKDQLCNSRVKIDTIDLDEENTPSTAKSDANQNTTGVDDTINLDDETSTVVKVDKNENTDKVESDEDVIDVEKENTFAKLLKNNTLMNKIILRCQTMENNAGMIRVVNRTVLPLYKEADNNYKESDEFTQVLNKVIGNLKRDPHHKFMHMKSLCDVLKTKQCKKKVPLVTLTTETRKTRDRSCRKRVKENFKEFRAQVKKRRDKTDVIVLDNDENEAVITLNDDDDDADDMHVKNNIVFNSDDNHKDVNKPDLNHSKIKHVNQGDPKYKNTKSINKDNDESNINVSKGGDIIGGNDSDVIVVDETVSRKSDEDDEQSNKENDEETINKRESSPECELLVPHNSVPAKKYSSEYNRAVKIEKLIEEYKQKIVQLEQEEVTYDSNRSPYILCDRYKANIVTLYKKLCRLTGNGDVEVKKCRAVRLRVIDGHPSEPVKRLEMFLNKTVDSTGHIPLPDFHDVVRIVEESNVMDKLRWSKRQVMKEALALFTHCGHALRKQRQKREYKDLLSLMRDKEIDDDDPAAKDPALLARLEENKLIAKANENEVLERYVKMQYLPSNAAILQDRQLEMEAGSSESDSDSDLTPKKRAKMKDMALPVHGQRESSVINNEIHKSQATNSINQPITQTCSIQNNLALQNSSNLVANPINTIPIGSLQASNSTGIQMCMLENGLTTQNILNSADKQVYAIPLQTSNPNCIQTSRLQSGLTLQNMNLLCNQINAIPICPSLQFSYTGPIEKSQLQPGLPLHLQNILNFVDKQIHGIPNDPSSQNMNSSAYQIYTTSINPSVQGSTMQRSLTPQQYANSFDKDVSTMQNGSYLEHFLESVIKKRNEIPNENRVKSTRPKISSKTSTVTQKCVNNGIAGSVLQNPVNVTLSNTMNASQCYNNNIITTTANASPCFVLNAAMGSSINSIFTLNTVENSVKTDQHNSLNTIQDTIKNIKAEIPEEPLQNSCYTASQTSTNISQNSSGKMSAPKNVYSKLDTLTKIGENNIYVIAYDSDEKSENSGAKTVNHSSVKTSVPGIVYDNNLQPTQKSEIVTVKKEPTIKTEPPDIEGLPDELGDTNIATPSVPRTAVDISKGSEGNANTIGQPTIKTEPADIEGSLDERADSNIARVSASRTVDNTSKGTERNASIIGQPTIKTEPADIEGSLDERADSNIAALSVPSTGDNSSKGIESNGNIIVNPTIKTEPTDIESSLDELDYIPAVSVLRTAVDNSKGTKSNENITVDLNIKTEPADIESSLDELGDSNLATVSAPRTADNSKVTKGYASTIVNPTIKTGPVDIHGSLEGLEDNNIPTVFAPITADGISKGNQNITVNEETTIKTEPADIHGSLAAVGDNNILTASAPRTAIDNSKGTENNENYIVNKEPTIKTEPAEIQTVQGLGYNNIPTVSAPITADGSSQVTEINEHITVKEEQTMKTEPADIQSLLDELGDNYITTIFDIEDPFLVIEVSDSSDDSDDEK